MVKPERCKVSVFSCQKRLHYPVPGRTPAIPFSNSFQPSFKSSGEGVVGKRDLIPFEQGCSVPVEKELPGVLLIDVRSPQEERQTKTHLESGSPERFHPQGKVHHAITLKSKVQHQTRRLGDIYRSEGCVFSYSHSPEVKKVPQVLFPGEDFSVQSSSVRHNVRPTSVHSHGSSGCFSSSGTGCSSETLSGRLVDSKRIKAKLSHVPTESFKSDARPGFCYQSGEVRVSPQPKFQFSGHELQHGRFFSRPSESQSLRFSEPNPIAQSSESSEVSGSAVFARSNRITCKHCPLGKVRETASSERGGVQICQERQSVGFGSQRPMVFPDDTDMASAGLAPVQGPDSSFGRGDFSFFRRFKHCMGRSCTRLSSSGSLVEGGTRFSHKLQGNGGCVPCSEGFPSNSQGKVGHSLFGQCSNPCLSSKSRRFEESESVEQSGCYSQVVRRQRDPSVSEVCERQTQRPGRPTQPSRSDHNCGVVHSCGVSETCLGSMGKTFDRSFCNPIQCPVTNVCIPIYGSSGLEDRRDVVLLEKSVPVCVSPVRNDSADPSKVVPGSSQINSNHSPLASKTLVSRSASIHSHSNNKTESKPKRSQTVKNKAKPCKSFKFRSDRLAAMRSKLQSRDFSQQSINLIINSKRAGTNSLYNHRWSRWVKYCQGIKVDPCHPRESEFCNFLSSLFYVNKFKPSTITGISSTITSTICAIVGKKPSFLQDGILVHNLLKGIANSSSVPTPTVQEEPWNLGVVLKFLCSDIFEPLESASLLALSLKTLFLVALASIKRISELNHISGLQKDVQFEPDGSGVSLVLLPEFRHKTQKPGSPPHSFFIPSLNEISGGDPDELILCPVRALKHYINRTNPFRRNKRKLFISIKPQHNKDIIKTTLGKWLVRVIAWAYERQRSPLPLSISAHQTRSVGSSMAYALGVKIEHIMRAATWSSNTIFISTYLRDVKTITSEGFRIKNVVLANQAVSI